MAKKTAHRHLLSGSERQPMPGARAAGAVLDDERIEVSVRVRAKPDAGDVDAGALGDQLPAARSYLSRDAFAARHGAAAADLSKVAAFANAHGLVVVQSSAPRRTVVLSGTAKAMSLAFGVVLRQYDHDGGTYRGRTGAISVPGEMAGIVEGVFGLDNRPQASPHFQVLGMVPGVAVARAATVSFTPPQVAKLYDFPAAADGSGQCIALIELGGGFNPADISAYFAGLKLPMPSVKAISVDGGRNAPSNANSADGEVMLDIEVAAGVAPKATIAVYFAPNTNQGFLDAITTAVHDSVNKPSVISISWGSAESTWTAQAMTQFDQAFQAAAAMGVTVCCAAGDNGSSDGVSDSKPHVDFPASSPYALGCGGTRMSVAGSKISGEVVWNDNARTSATGGGVSGFFAVPAYQKSVKLPTVAGSNMTGRGVPDVAGDADPNSGYSVRVDGQSLVIGGTSAVAPLWAGLIALLNQQLGKPVGFLNPLLYGSLVGTGAFRDVVSGNNGSYSAGPGWDACTGWGSPIGSKLLAGLGAKPIKKVARKR